MRMLGVGRLTDWQRLAGLTIILGLVTSCAPSPTAATPLPAKPTVAVPAPTSVPAPTPTASAAAKAAPAVTAAPATAQASPVVAAKPTMPAVAAAPASKDAPIAVKGIIGSTTTSIVHLPLHLARERKYFEAEGLNVTWTDGSTATIATTAVISGDADFGITATSTVISAVGQNQALKVFAPMNQGVPYVLYVSRTAAQRHQLDPAQPVTEKIRKLKGLRLGGSGPGSSNDIDLRYLLLEAGLNPDTDVTIVNLTGATMPPAMQQDRVDGVLISPPGPLQLLGEQAISYLNLTTEVPAFARYAHQVAAAKPSYIQAHPEVIEKVTRALAKAVHDLTTDPDGSRDFLGQTAFKQLDPAVWRRSFDETRGMTPTNLVIGDDLIENVVKVDARVSSAGAPAVKPRDVIDNTFAEKVRKEMGS